MVKASLSVELASLRLRNPVMLAAGILGVTGLSLKQVAEAGAGAVVSKSIGPEPREGYGNPTFTGAPGGFLNSMGLPNPGAEAFAHEVKIAKEGGVPVVVSIFGGSKQEFARVGVLMEEAGADALELNLSCPHSKLVAFGQSPELTFSVVEAVKNSVGVPVFAKLTPNVADIAAVARKAEEAGADAVTCINTLRAMAIDAETGRPILANRFGGLSGPAIKPVAVRCVFEVAEAISIPVIGSGGITTGQDAVEFLLAGASAVQVGSAVALKDLEVFREVASGIQAYLDRKGCRSVKEIVGLSHGF